MIRKGRRTSTYILEEDIQYTAGLLVRHVYATTADSGQPYHAKWTANASNRCETTSTTEAETPGDRELVGEHGHRYSF